MSLQDRLNKAQSSQKIILKEQPTSDNLERMREIALKKSRQDDLDILETLSNDDEVTSIYINGAKNIYLEKNGQTHKAAMCFRDNVRLEEIIKKSAKIRGYEFSPTNPYVIFNIMENSMLEAFLPPLVNAPSINVKFYRDKFSNFDNLLDRRFFSKEISLVLQALLSSNENIIITGRKNSSKTTLLSAMAKKLPKNSRGIIIDYKNEITIPEPKSDAEDYMVDLDNCSAYNFFEITKNYSKDLEINTLSSILSSNPQRIFINGASDSNLPFIMKKLEDGLKGIILTIEANNLEDALSKLTFVILKNNPSISYEVASLICHKIFNVGISVDFDESGSRKITYISEISVKEGESKVNDIFFSNPLGEHQSSGNRPEFYRNVNANFLPLGVNIFDSEYKHTYNTPLYEMENKEELKARLQSKTKVSKYEIIKKAKGKFEKLKQSAKSQPIQDDNIDIEDETI